MDVSVITINYNTSQETLQCVESILEHTSNELDYEIVVVDNNSEPEDFLNLKENLIDNERVHLIRSRINLGFGGGNNFGLQKAKGKYYAFINNDCELTEDTFTKLFQFMEEHKNVGVSGPRITKPSGEMIRGFGHFMNLPPHLIGARLYYKFSNKISPWTDVKETMEVDLVIGSLMFIRAEVFHSVGGFDTNIFLYFEEMDICYRIKKKGFQVKYFPKTTYIHHEGGSSHSVNNRITILKEQQISYHYFFRKNYGFLQFALMRFASLLKSPFKFMINPKENGSLVTLNFRGNSLSESLKQKQLVGKKLLEE